MYIAITPQKIGATYANSVSDYVAYLEKENRERPLDDKEHFFDQNNDRIAPEQVISGIDGNTAKLRKRDAKFYSLVVSPSQKELQQIGNDPERLRKYVRELMKDYADSFNRNREVSVEDLKYFAKIEHERTYRGFDKKVQENAPYRKEIAKLRNDIRKIERGEREGKVKSLERRIEKLIAEAPHKEKGKLVETGMKKEGYQTHVHIIVSRKDMTNRYTLSPLSKERASEVVLNGESVKKGFDRNRFYEAAEKTFDRVSGYRRNYVETFLARKAFVLEPKKFFAKLIGLPVNERDVAFELMRKTGMRLPHVPTNHQVQLALKAYHGLRKGLKRAVHSASIEI